MASRTINLSQAAARYRELGKRFWPAVLRGARLGGERARAYMVEQSKAEAFDRGGYARTWKSEVSASGRTLSVYNQSPYAAIIERGRRPGARQPPTKALVPWVRRKLGVSRKDAEGIAFLVARKIGEDGTPGKFIMARARGRIIKLVMEEIEDSLRRTIRGP